MLYCLICWLSGVLHLEICLGGKSVHQPSIPFVVWLYACNEKAKELQSNFPKTPLTERINVAQGLASISSAEFTDWCFHCQKSQLRIKIEMTFGILVSKFQIF